MNIFQSKLGFKPQGFIMPGERPTPETPEMLVDLGYKYWMSALHEDLPYLLKVGNKGELVSIWLADHRTGQADACRPTRELRDDMMTKFGKQIFG